MELTVKLQGQEEQYGIVINNIFL